MLAEVTGTVTFGKETKGKQRLIITDQEGNSHETLISKDKTVLVHDGQVVQKGEEVVDGPVDPHDILRLLGIEELARYIVDEVQDVYRLQGVKINDKHIEVIVRQMLRRVQITDPGDTHFIQGEQVERSEMLDENDRVTALGKRPATYENVLLHFGSVFPRNNASTDGSCHHGQARRPAWFEGKRDRWPSDSGRYGSCLPSGS